MPRKLVPKPHCSGNMTVAAYQGFIRSTLRRASLRWRPRGDAKKAARHPIKLAGRTARLVYHSKCADCGELHPEVDARVDHIVPVVDPSKGFTTWDDFIYNLLCEVDNLQVLCTKCHHAKTQAEKEIATERKRQEKLDDTNSTD